MKPFKAPPYFWEFFALDLACFFLLQFLSPVGAFFVSLIGIVSGMIVLALAISAGALE